MKHLSHSVLTCLAFVLFLVAPPAQAQWIELVDAGDIAPTSAQTVSGLLPLTFSITGTFLGPDDVDIFRIRIDNPNTFGASTVGVTLSDSALFVMDGSGRGLVFNDDEALAVLQGAIPPGSLQGIPPGVYYLGIARSGRIPGVSGVGGIWDPAGDRRAVRAPDGPAADLPMDTIIGTGTGLLGAYEILISSAEELPVGYASYLLSVTGRVEVLEDSTNDVPFELVQPMGVPERMHSCSASSVDTELFSTNSFAVTNVTSNTWSLAIAPAFNAYGTGTVWVTANDSIDTFSTAIQLVVLPVNDPPSFELVDPVYAAPSSDAGGGAASDFEANILENISMGPANESNQVLIAASVQTAQSSLFSVQPTVTSNGVLSFRPALNASGTAFLSIRIQDSGGTTNNGVDLSEPRTLSVILSPNGGGTATSGTATSGTATSGTATSGTATSGTATSGTGTSGTATSGTATSGTATSGTATSGTATSGTATAGDSTGGSNGGATTGGPVFIPIGDIDNDGNPDLVAQTKKSVSIYLLTNGQSAGVVLNDVFSLPARFKVRAVRDLNGDGPREFIAQRGKRITAVSFIAPGSAPAFAAATKTLPTRGALAATVSVNGDTNVDLLLQRGANLFYLPGPNFAEALPVGAAGVLRGKGRVAGTESTTNGFNVMSVRGRTAHSTGFGTNAAVLSGPTLVGTLNQGRTKVVAFLDIDTNGTPDFVTFRKRLVGSVPATNVAAAPRAVLVEPLARGTRIVGPR